MNRLEQKILRAVQQGMPLSMTPYQDIADDIGIPVDQLLGVLRRWQSEDKIRRLGAIVNHFQVGQGAGAMVAWQVAEDSVQRIGELFAACPNVSHAYQRASCEQWPYNLYTMVHAADNDELETVLATLCSESRIHRFRVLKTVRELKKVPPMYIMKD